MMLRMPILGVMLGTIAGCACGHVALPADDPTQAPAHAGAIDANGPAGPGNIVAPGDAKIGDRTRCPVSKGPFTVTATSPSATYQGKTYYFCCPGCDKRFLADPEKYLQGV